MSLTYTYCAALLLKSGNSQYTNKNDIMRILANARVCGFKKKNAPAKCALCKKRSCGRGLSFNISNTLALLPLTAASPHHLGQPHGSLYDASTSACSGVHVFTGRAVCKQAERRGCRQPAGRSLGKAPTAAATTTRSAEDLLSQWHLCPWLPAPATLRGKLIAM